MANSRPSNAPNGPAYDQRDQGRRDTYHISGNTARGRARVYHRDANMQRVNNTMNNFYQYPPRDTWPPVNQFRYAIVLPISLPLVYYDEDGPVGDLRARASQQYGLPQHHEFGYQASAAGAAVQHPPYVPRSGQRDVGQTVGPHTGSCACCTRAGHGYRHAAQAPLRSSGFPDPLAAPIFFEPAGREVASDAHRSAPSNYYYEDETHGDDSESYPPDDDSENWGMGSG